VSVRRFRKRGERSERYPYDISSSLAVYTYRLPRSYNSRPEELPLVSQTFEALRAFFGTSSLATDNPSEADYFFVPLNLIQYQFRNEDPKAMLSTLRYLDPARPDHLIVALGDYSQRSKKNHYGNAYQETYDWLGPFILLALESTGDLITDQDIGIIPWNTLSEQPTFNDNERPLLYSFLGETSHELLPKTHIRFQMTALQSDDSLVARKLTSQMRKKLEGGYPDAKDDYELVSRSSIFTLAPAGYGSWTYRFFQAIQWGSIPVLISDDYIKPYQAQIPYELFTVTVPEKDVTKIDAILRSIKPNEILRRQGALRQNQRHFTRSSFLTKLVRELEQRRDRR
jgi:hypothetical protein